MPAPSQLAIATSSLQRLVKEETSYRKEVSYQETRIAEMEAQEQQAAEQQAAEKVESSGTFSFSLKGQASLSGNFSFQLKQERQALEQTKAVLPGARERILLAKEKLENMLESSGDAEDEDVKNAKKALSQVSKTT